MKLPTNTFKAALSKGERQVGIWVGLCSPLAAEICAHAGFDWALIDMEHSPNDVGDVLAQLQAVSATATTPIVRVPWNDPVMVKRVLDLGAPGVMFPMVQTVEEAQAAVASCRYPPHGIRGFAGGTRATQYGRITDYASRVAEETAIILQVETRAAVERAQEIGSVEGVSGVFFGPADIAADLGYLGQPMHPEVWAFIRAAAKGLIAKGIPVGTLVLDTGFAAELLNDGFSFVACGVDGSLLARASDAALAQVKERLS